MEDSKLQRTYYEKIDGEFVPVREHDYRLMDSFPEGTHLVVCEPGSNLRKYNINRESAPLTAAGTILTNQLTSIIFEVSRGQLNNSSPLTQEQKEAWEHLNAVMGNKMSAIEMPAVQSIAEAIVDVLKEESNSMMLNPGVKKAYDNFLLAYTLSKENNE